jgi:predicted AlkP superfamily phosphohydrolase/phosphomutase
MAAPVTHRRLLIIGLDGTPPGFLFDRLLPVMPNVRRLYQRGAYARLRSTDPPITVPAWPVMFTGADPGTIGFYGFRHRRAQSYFETYVPSSDLLKVPTVFQLLSSRGLRVGVIGMPPGYPPPRVNGFYISDFLTPGGRKDYTYPPALRTEIESRFGPYRFDVVFRAQERVQLYQDIRTMTSQRFAIAEALYAREKWDLFAIHEIGTDRLHHAYWKYFDRGHPDYQPGNPFENVAEEYYAELDSAIGRLIALTDEHTAILIVSDHGSMRMDGCFCINEWLQAKGYLALAHPVPPGTPIERANVVWSKTSVWGTGGYYARLYFNIRGREPEGIVPPEELPRLRQRLAQDLAGILLPDGTPLKVEVLDPKEAYRSVQGDPPDLMLYFGNLRWRSAGTVGYPSLFLKENDTGPDDSVHDFDGVFLFADPEVPHAQDLGSQQIIDVAPTILRWFGEPIPPHVQGSPIRGIAARPSE